MSCLTEDVGEPPIVKEEIKQIRVLDEVLIPQPRVESSALFYIHGRFPFGISP
jgi:hypothetical protein